MQGPTGAAAALQGTGTTSPNARPVRDRDSDTANPDSRPVRDKDSDTANPDARPVRDRDSDTANPNARPLRDRDSDTANPNARPVGRDRENNASRLTPSISPVEASKEAVQTIPVLMRRADLEEPMVAYILGKGYEGITDSTDNKLFKSLSGSQTSFSTEEYWYPDVFPKFPESNGLYVLGISVSGTSVDFNWVETEQC